MKKRLLLFVLAALLLVTPVLAKEMGIAVAVTSIEEYDIDNGKYTMHFWLGLQCDYDCSIDELVLINGRTLEAFETEDIAEFGMKVYRVTAVLQDNVELRRYPFDTQQLSIIVEPSAHRDLNLYVIPKMGGVDERVGFPGWDVEGFSQDVERKLYPNINQEVWRYKFILSIDRQEMNTFIKHFIPLLFLISIILFTFMLGIDRLELRLGVVTSILVAAVVLHLTITSGIPPVGYLTFADKFLMATYAVALASCGLNITLIRLMQLKKKKLAEKIFRQSRYWVLVSVPLIYGILFLFFI